MPDITRAEYYTEIHRIADILEDRYISGDIDDMQDAIHETIDNHEWVTYAKYYFDVLKHSENWENADEEGFIDRDAGLSKILQVAAYCAMSADVQEVIRPISDLEKERETIAAA